MTSFGRPEAVVLLVLVAVIVGAGLWLERWRRRARSSFSGPQASRWRGNIAWTGALLFVLAGVLITIAAMQPRWGSREQVQEREGVDLIIVLDISTSMAAADAVPTRLQLAQQELTRLVEAQRGNRVGLVFFAGTAIARSPLTTDTGAITKLIARADREVGLTRTGSDLGAALTIAMNLLESSESPGKAVLLVSDGEDHQNTYPAAITLLAEKNIAVYTAGVGTTSGSTITQNNALGQPRTKLQTNGQPVITRLNETTLRAIASGPNGRYLNLSSGGLVSLQDDLASLQQTPLGSDENLVPVERFQLFAGVAFVLLVLSWLAPERLRWPSIRAAAISRPAPGVAVALLAMLIGACSGDTDYGLRDRVAAANQLYNDGRYDEALAAYEGLLVERPDVPEIAYNAGNTLNRQGEYERAVAETQRSLPPTTNRLGNMSYYGLGNHYLAQGQPALAYEAYRNALLLDSNDQDAKFNLEVALLLMANPDQPPDNQGQGSNGGEQPQQPGDQPGQPGDQPSQPQPGQPGNPTPGATPGPSPAEAQRTLQEALRGLDDELTFEEAIEILDALRMQQERPLQQNQPQQSGPDY